MQSHDLQAVLVLAFIIALSVWLSRFLSQAIVGIAQKVAVRGNNETREDKFIMYRQVETYLSVAVAVVRALVVMIAVYIAWRLLLPQWGNSATAAIATSALILYSLVRRSVFCCVTLLLAQQ